MRKLYRLGTSFYYLKNYDKALKHLGKTINLMEEIYPTGHEDILKTYELAIEVCGQKKDMEKAAELAENCYKNHVTRMAYDSHPYYESQILLGRILRIAGKWEKAEKIYREVIENGEILWELIKEKPSSDDSMIFDIAVAYNEIAFHLYVPGQIWIEAEKYYRRAIELMETQKNEVEYANMRLNLCTVLHKSGKPIDEDEVRRLRDILIKVGDPRAEKGDKIIPEREGRVKL